MTSTANRQPRGIPTGGQFAATTHSEPGVSLSALRSEPSPSRTPWTEKRIQAAAAARREAAENLARDMEAASTALKGKQQAADQEFFDWDTDFAAAGLRGLFRAKYLRDRAALKQMFREDPEYRYNREYSHKKLAPVREGAQVMITKALNKIADRTGGDTEWFIRL
jgi:hypothetical protein